MTNINIKEILWKLHIDSLTAMQQTTVEEYRKGKDLVLISPTGSGKTVAYLLPLVQSLKEENDYKYKEALAALESMEYDKKFE